MLAKDSCGLMLVMLFVMFTHAVRVYEDHEEGQELVDISGNSNSTGPVLYPGVNNTSMMNNLTSEETNNDEPEPSKNTTTTENQSMGNMHNTGQQNSTENIMLRSNVSNRTNNQAAKVKENSSLRQRQSYQINTKPFVSSPEEIATRMAQEGKILNAESFQPMVDTPFRPSEQLQKPSNPAGYKQYHPTPPRSQIEEPIHSQSHFSTTRSKQQELVHHHATPRPQHQEHPQLNFLRDQHFREPQYKLQSHEQQNVLQNYHENRPNFSGTGGIDYEQFQRQFFPKDSFHREQQQSKFNSIEEYVLKPLPNNNIISWPENQNTELSRHPTVWTTEQPDFGTNPYKYIPSPTEYEPPKGFFSSALSMLTQSLKPSVPTHPYPFEFTEHPKSYFSANTEYQVPTAGHGGDHSDHKTYEKYEIITTSSPEYHFLSKPPSESGMFHGTEMAKPFHHNLPWHKIIKVLTAIIPIGLLVSALTPNVVLINPNATSPNSRPVGNIYSYVTRQRSLEPEHAFNERIMLALDGLLVNDQDPNAACVRQAICGVIDASKFENLTPDEYSAFQNKMCKNHKKVTAKCNQS